MTIGKGFFWSGLSEGVRGLYNQFQNERMAEDAQASRERQAALDRDMQGRAIRSAYPLGDMYNRKIAAIKTMKDEVNRLRAALAETYGDARKPLEGQLKVAEGEAFRAEAELKEVENQAMVEAKGTPVAPKLPPRRKSFMEELSELK